MRCCRRRCRSIVTYLTAQAKDGQLAFVDDVYGRDTQRLAQIASMAN